MAHLHSKVEKGVEYVGFMMVAHVKGLSVMKYLVHTIFSIDMNQVRQSELVLLFFFSLLAFAWSSIYFVHYSYSFSTPVSDSCQL